MFSGLRIAGVQWLRTAGVRAGGAACQPMAAAAVLTTPVRTVMRRSRRGLEQLPTIRVPIETLPRVGLDTIAPVPGSVRDKIRAGRGRSGKRGKTAGRGHKGSGQRNKNVPWFQGGQTPVWQKWPKRGRPNSASIKYVPVNVGTIASAIEAGKLDPAYPMNMRHLWRAGVVSGSIKSMIQDRWGVKLLSTGAETLKVPITIEVQRASRKAIEAVEAAGGTITCKYYGKINLRALLMPHKFRSIPRIPLPPPKRQGWYLRPENRGVLATVTEVPEASSKVVSS
eukprot:m.38534 g.38534  ORF g.38534 m.38534 type:complete len:282 (-) comp5671_c0_seq1:55-900(-)